MNALRFANFLADIVETDAGQAMLSVAFDPIENTLPVFEQSVFSTDEDTPALFNLAEFVTDADGDEVMLSLLQGPGKGSASFDSEGRLAFDPGLDFQNLPAAANETVEVLVLADDGQGGQVEQTITINVAGRNDAAVIGNTTAEMILTNPLPPSLTPVKRSDEFLLSATEAFQNDVSVSALATGGFVATWTTNAQDGDSGGVFAQLFTDAGERIGEEFQVNTFTMGNQSDSQVASLGQDQFIVTWTSFGQEGTNAEVYAQRYSLSGEPIGTEFRINTFTQASQNNSSVTVLNDDSFVVTWTSSPQDGDLGGVFGQRFDSDGQKLGGEFQINTFTPSSQGWPTVKTLENGDFVVVWDSFSQDGSGSGVYGQRYDQSGVKLGGEFQINTFTPSFQIRSDMAELADGGFVVTWTSSGQDGSSAGVFGQMYDVGGQRVGTEFQVNTFTDNRQDDSSVVGLDDGGFLVTWTSFSQDETGGGILGQRFDAQGQAVGDEFQVSTAPDGNQGLSDLTVLQDGSVLAAWQSSVMDDFGFFPLSGGVYAQRLEMPTEEPEPLTLTGQLTIDDIDDGEEVFVDGVYQGSFGSVVLLEDGTWTFSLDQEAQDQIVANNIQSDNIEVQSIDGTTEELEIQFTLVGYDFV